MINILLFAHLQEIAGEENLKIEATSITVSELKSKLTQEYGLKDLQNVMVAVNEEYANNDDTINNGDTVALIPPVSGG